MNKQIRTILCTVAVILFGLGRIVNAATITLAWTPNAESDLAGYVVYYGTQPGVYTATTDVGKNATPQLTNLVGGTTYYFVVKAYNASSLFSVASQEVSVLVPGTSGAQPPSVPASPMPASGATGVSLTTPLTWAPSTSATQYDVAFGTANPPSVISVKQTGTTFQPTLAAGTTYFWQILARGSGGTASGPVWSFTTVGPKPVAAYSFNEGAGTTAGDASGFGNVGSVVNAAWTTAGKSGGAMTFNGASSRVTIPDATSLRLTTAMTLEAWVKPTATSSAWLALVYKGSWSTGEDNFFLATMPGLAPLGGSTTGAAAAPALALNTWTHLAMTFDGANVKVYTNGVLSSTSPATGPIVTSANPLQIGGDSLAGTSFPGSIDDVRIYNAALTVAQIQSDMNTPVATTVDTQAPTAPATVTATPASTSQINLTWPVSADNIGVTGYRIERCQGAGCTSFAQVGTSTTASFSDTGLVPATSYSYRVLAVDAAANLSAFSAIATAASMTPVAAPSVPSSPSPVANASGIGLTATLAWAPSSNATTYDVAFGTSNPPVVVASNQTATSYRPTLAAGTTYFWHVVAKGVGGSTTGPVWSFSTPAMPTVPSNPSPAMSATGVALTSTLSWAASTNATQYSLALGTSNPPAVVSSSLTATSFQPTLVAGTTYFWQVVATGAAGSTTGPVWSFSTVAAPAPKPVAAYSFNEATGTTVGDATGNGNVGSVVNATWTTAGKTGGALTFGGASSRVSIADASSLRLTTAMTLEAWVKPTATSSAWLALVYKGSWSTGEDNYFMATMPGLAPLAGSTTGAAAAPALALNTWTHLAMTYDGATVKLYTNGVLSSSNAMTGAIATSAFPLEIGGDVLTGTSFPGSIDDVRIYNAALTVAQVQADMNTPVVGTIDTQLPTAPAGLTATPVSTSQVNLNWTASTDNLGVTGYRIERCQAAGCTTFAQIATATATTFSNTGLQALTAYSYRVRATDAAGNLSAYSNTSVGTTTAPVAPPTTPANVAATSPSTTQVTLTWTPSTVSTGTAGYLVERCQWAGCSTFAQVGTSSGPSYSDAALLAGMSYSYRVRATDSTNSLSGYSNVATVVTKGGNSSLVAAYAFDEGTGTTARDSSTIGNTGTVINATWTAGKNGSALSFDGNSPARVTVPDAASLRLANAMTIEAWIKPSSTNLNDWHAVVYKGVDNYVLATNYGTGLAVAGGTMGSNLNLTTGGALVPANAWTHLATTYNGTTVRLYVNGVLVSTTAASGALKASTSPLEIGGSLADLGLFAGVIDDVRIYSTALTVTQIQTDMNTAVPGR